MNQPAPRRLRWQLSLRVLLVFMALVGVGLTVYRWPWVETKRLDVMPHPTPPLDPFVNTPPEPQQVLYSYEQRTTYRRNWGGQPVKNGVEEYWRDNRLWHESHYYDGELHGPRRVYDRKGEVTYEVHYQQGDLHGPAWCREGREFRWTGAFVNKKPQGTWESMVDFRAQYSLSEPEQLVEFDFPETTWLMQAPVRVISNWDQGKRHGLWTWEWQDTGSQIRTAEYSQGDLVRWNGKPVVEEVVTDLSQQASDEAVQILAFFDRAKGKEWRVGQLSHLSDNCGFCVQLETRPDFVETLYVHGVNLPREHLGDSPNLLPALCELAAKTGCRLEYRYGGLLLVPRSADDKPFVDPTGVERVKFEVGSPQERDWNQVVSVLSSCSGGSGCVEDLLSRSSIACEIEPDSRIRFENACQEGHLLFQRRRCDAIALVCYLTGLRCVQQGEELNFTRDPGQTTDQALNIPLQIPIFPEPRGCR